MGSPADAVQQQQWRAAASCIASYCIHICTQYGTRLVMGSPGDKQEVRSKQKGRQAGASCAFTGVATSEPATDAGPSSAGVKHTAAAAARPGMLPLLLQCFYCMYSSTPMEFATSAVTLGVKLRTHQRTSAAAARPPLCSCSTVRSAGPV
jgi:hypothetical protein